MSYGSMPGYGDAATWGPIRGPRDPRYVEQDPEALAAERQEVLGTIADSIYGVRIKSAAWVSDAQGFFETPEYAAINVAIINADLAETAGNDAECMAELIKIGRMTLEATRAAIKRDARKEAAISLDKLEREDEADYYSAAVAS